MKSTNIYNKRGDFIRSEKLLTFAEYIQLGRLKPGQYILLADIEGSPTSYSLNTKSVFIGDATPYHAPTDNDAEFGGRWDYESKICKKFVLEVHEYV